MRHEHKLNMVSYLTNIILGNSCNGLGTAELKIQIVFISHNFRILNNSMLTVIFININILNGILKNNTALQELWKKLDTGEKQIRFTIGL